MSWFNITFPPKLDNIKTFEDNYNVVINVYGYVEIEIASLRISNHASERIVSSHASAVAQGNVLRVMSASYGKSLYSTLRTNQTPKVTTTNNNTIDNVDDLNRCANFHPHRKDKGAPTHT
jgi:hypothetical protein